MGYMSDEIVGRLNRIANDRSLSLNSRKIIFDAIRHIRELDGLVQQSTGPDPAADDSIQDDQN